MTIRKADRTDLEEIYRLSNVLEETVLDREGFRQAYEEAVDSDTIFVLEEEKIIGFIHIRIASELCRAGKILEIRELVIDEGYRGKGYGRLLLERAEAYGKENGVVLIELLSALRRERAHRFYENNGYSKTGYRFFKKQL